MNKLYLKYEQVWKCANPSRQLDDMIKVLEDYLKDYDYVIDENSNILIGDFEKERACLVAHLDSVHKKTGRVRKKKHIIYSDEGIGGDDKCGIVAILELLKNNNNVNAILTSDEEIGGIGASNINIEYLKNILYFIEIDRMGNNDVIFESGMNQICSDEMKDELLPILSENGFSENWGSFTDVNILTQSAKKSAINISCGYYNPHTSYEYVNLNHLQHTILTIQEIISTIQKSFSWSQSQLNDLYKKSYFSHDLQNYKMNCDGCGKSKYTKEVIFDGYYYNLCKKCRKKLRRNARQKSFRCVECGDIISTEEGLIYGGYCNECWLYYCDKYSTEKME